MKIAIGFKTKKGPWGGGNKFVLSLSNYLKTNGHFVTYYLNDIDIDVILIIDPRFNHPNVTFTPKEILRYLLFKNKNAIVVHRINECDERKKTKFTNFILRLSNYCADHSVFVGQWMTHLNLLDKKNINKFSIIKNGSNKKVFNSKNYKKWDKKRPFKLVTHHWSKHWMKGFDVYKKIDDLIEQSKWKNKIKFTYIGKLPQNFNFKNTSHIYPLDEKQLSIELPKHHGYITASINEPGGNHQNEGALCGLPILYRNSGCFPEYCKGFGVSFNFEDLEKKLSIFLKNYSFFATKMGKYPHTDDKTNKQYLDLFNKLIKSRGTIVKKRRIFRSFFKLFLNHFI